MIERTFLVLENGSVYPGKSFGAPAPTIDELEPKKLRFSATGEVVFNTAMVGYYEVLTDPSYTGQLVTMTYPHMGNYGTTIDWNESGPVLDADGQSRDTRPIKAAGFIVRSVYRGPVPKGRISLDEYLSEHGIPGITDIDTRRLTLELREKGSQTGVLIRSRFNQTLELPKPEFDAALSYLKAYPKMEGLNLVPEVGTRQKITPKTKGENGKNSEGPLIALYDCGVKANIVREFTRLGAQVVLLPSHFGAKEILEANPDAVMVSNGPGDPGTLQSQVDAIRSLVGKLPVFGICLGHQLIAQALGGKTYKMKFGHHGINHPVRDEITKRVFVTSQNHGFAVDEKSLPEGVQIWFRNANDGTNEGIFSDKLKVYSAQFHPESSPGPYDSHWIFEHFLSAIRPSAAGAHETRDQSK